MSKINMEEDPHVTVLPSEIHRICGYLSAHGEQGRRYADRLDTFAREMVEDQHDSDLLRERMSGLLTGVANALKGDPPELTSWSWHDLPELATNREAEVERLRTKVEEAEEYRAAHNDIVATGVRYKRERNEALRDVDDMERRVTALRSLAEWLVSLDDPDPRASGRQTVTLNQIIERARAAIAEPSTEIPCSPSCGITPHKHYGFTMSFPAEEPTWVCDGCMNTVSRDQIAEMADFVHVLCKSCSGLRTAGPDQVLAPAEPTTRDRLVRLGSALSADLVLTLQEQRDAANTKAADLQSRLDAINEYADTRVRRDNVTMALDLRAMTAGKQVTVSEPSAEAARASLSEETLAAFYGESPDEGALCDDPVCGSAPHKHHGDGIEYVDVGKKDDRLIDNVVMPPETLAERIKADGQLFQAGYEEGEAAAQVDGEGDIPLAAIRRASQAFLEAQHDYMGQDIAPLDSPMRAALTVARSVLTGDQTKWTLADRIRSHALGLRTAYHNEGAADELFEIAFQVECLERWADR